MLQKYSWFMGTTQTMPHELPLSQVLSSMSSMLQTI
jgi:hypothetical protein